MTRTDIILMASMLVIYLLAFWRFELAAILSIPVSGAFLKRGYFDLKS